MNRTISWSMLLICSMLYQIGLFAQQEANSNYLYQTGVPDSLYSNILEEQRDFWIHLPDKGNLRPGYKYPVVYVLDGSVQMDALSTVYNYYWGHHLPKMILVGISNRTNRTRDLTISKITNRRGAAFNGESGGAEDFLSFIGKELIPHMEEKYPAAPHRTLIGHSYAGLFVINALLKNDNIFKNFIAIDPSIEWNNQELLTKAKLDLRKRDYTGKSLFVAMGGPLHMQNSQVNLSNVMQDTSEYSLFSRSIIEFSNLAENLKGNGLNFLWKHYPEDLHGTIPLPAIRDGLLAQFEWFQVADFYKFNDPETPLEELLKIVQDRENVLSTNFGYAVPPLDEEFFNMGGYMFLQTDQLEKAYAFFKMAIKYFPSNANVYDSMADYYLAIDNKKEARVHIQKALELDNSEYLRNRLLKIEQK